MKNPSYLVDTPETTEIKRYALETLRADLVGIADIKRFANAPLRMSPQGIMPTARSVIVMAVHHPDAAMERGGLEHPQIIGPYAIQYSMNWRLDDMSYRMSRFLEEQGFQAVPIASSNIWRYRGYKELTAQFAPDVSHMHCAVAAGLAEFGFNGLALTPEFGAHQRYVTIITDAVLTPSPLLEPGSVCDNCMICRRECRSGALSKEINGWNEVKIEDKVYRYANKNLWRCAWGSTLIWIWICPSRNMWMKRSLWKPPSNTDAVPVKWAPASGTAFPVICATLTKNTPTPPAVTATLLPIPL